MQGELAPRRVERGHQQRRRARRAQQAQHARRRRRGRCAAPAGPADVEHGALGQRAGDLVRARQHGVGAELQGARRQVRVEAEVRAPAWSTTSGDVVRRGATRREPLDVGDHAVVRRRDDERRATPRPARARERLVERRRRDAVGHAELLVVLGRDEARARRRRAPARRRSTRASCAARRRGAPSGASARHSAWLPCVAPLVEEPRARGAVGLGGEPLGLARRASATGRGRCRGCPAARRSPAPARRARSAGPGRRRGRPCARARGSAPGRGRRSRRRASRYGAVGWPRGRRAGQALAHRAGRPQQLRAHEAVEVAVEHARWRRRSRSPCGGP